MSAPRWSHCGPSASGQKLGGLRWSERLGVGSEGRAVGLFDVGCMQRRQWPNEGQGPRWRGGPGVMGRSAE
jgi:hypothetical protein